MRSKSRFTTLVLLETPGELSSEPCAIALYASRPLSPGATQHSLPSGRYPLLGPVFHRLDRTSLPGALIRSSRRRGRAAPKGPLRNNLVTFLGASFSELWCSSIPH